MKQDSGNPDAALEALRAELDQIDDEVMDALRRRLECCVRIGELKRDAGIAMMQPGRIQYVRSRISRYAANAGLSERFLLDVYALVVEEACRLETDIIGDEQS